MAYATKYSAQRAARRQFGKNSKDGYDWIIVTNNSTSPPIYDYQPGPKYDDPAPAQKG